MNKFLTIILCLFSISAFSLETIHIRGVDMTEMTKAQVQKEIEGDYYVYSPQEGIFYDPDNGLLGIVISSNEILITHNFVQTIFPAKGSGNITGKVPDHASYSNGKWFVYSFPSGRKLYYYTYYEFYIEYMMFENTKWIGNGSDSKPALTTSEKGLFFSQDDEGKWLYIGNSGTYRFEKFGAEEIARVEAQKKEEEIRRQKAEEERKIREKEAEERRIREAEEKRRLAEEKRQIEEARKRIVEEQKLARENAIRQKQLFKDSIKNGFVQGHECVDLGLSVAWATCNIGAASEKKLGKAVSESNVGKMLTWGGNWRLPSEKECYELIDNCSYQGIGFPVPIYVKFTSKKNGKSIILPFYGQIWTNVKGRAFYWNWRHEHKSHYDTYATYLRCVIPKE